MFREFIIIMIDEKTAHGEQDSVLKGIMAVMSSDVATPPLCCVCGGKMCYFHGKVCIAFCNIPYTRKLSIRDGLI